MRYIFPKNQNISNLKIIENNSIFKIKNTINTINTINISGDIIIFGIILKITDAEVNFNLNEYIIKINKENRDKINYYESILINNIPNYKPLISYTNSYFKVKQNKVISDIFKERQNEFYLNFKYVKKCKFLNIPVINIIKI